MIIEVSFMAKKSVAVEQKAQPAKKAVVKKSAPRVKAAKHRTPPAVSLPEVRETPREITQAMIAAIAYGYWESRERQGGDPVEDWLRAENELSRKI
jgi:Protein of unknown function (DUF2934)